MSAPASINRRRRAREKVRTGARASFGTSCEAEVVDLCEILDISELGMALQCPSPMEINQEMELCLHVTESSEQLSVTARVVWSNSSGRLGLGFSAVADSELHRVQEWLSLNTSSGSASSGLAVSSTSEHSSVSLNHTDKLSGVATLQKEAESVGENLEAVVSLIALRCHSLLRCSGVAVALSGKDDANMTCRASSGSHVPPVGATLKVGSGFSGECVRAGRILRCDDTEEDDRVDRESCRALVIRSILAAPVSSGKKVIGLLEAFSAQPRAFGDNDSRMLQRFAETISSAIDRAALSDHSFDPAVSMKLVSSVPGGVLFAYKPTEPTGEANLTAHEGTGGGIQFPSTFFYCAAAAIVLILGFLLSPWIQEKLKASDRTEEPVVLDVSRPPIEATNPDSPLNSGEIEQLRALAGRGNPEAENAMGLLYAEGDKKLAIKQDQSAAVRWFTRAADHGSTAAQYKLALLYWNGHGVSKNANKAYFWALRARAGGQEGSQDLVRVLASSMDPAQAATIEQQAEIWNQRSRGKTHSGR
jgi:putative methionine-R-sulfoxide reductase with GAF domain